MALLTSGWLRRVALPLRAANPALYSTLNQVRKQVIARGRSLAAYQAVAIDRFARRVPLSGARVLEIGGDPDLKLLRQFRERGAAESIGVNNDLELFAGSSERADGPLRLVHADVAALPFPDGHFDALFSVATFEHILDLPRALAEMHRVLRPGGVVYANFGPIWSGGKGHHLRVQVGDERAWHGDPRLNPLPDFAHLLLGPRELRSALAGRVSPALEQPIADFVFTSPYINRMFHHEYLRDFAQSPLRVESLTPERDPVAPQLQRILELKYPKERAFDVTNTEVILVKDD